MANNATRLNEKYCIVRKPDSQGAIVMKLGNEPLVPGELYTHPDLVFQSVSRNSALTDKTIDRGGMDPNGELADLMREHWGVEDFS